MSRQPFKTTCQRHPPKRRYAAQCSQREQVARWRVASLWVSAAKVMLLDQAFNVNRFCAA